MTTQHLSAAEHTFVGAADVAQMHGPNKSKGVPVTFAYKAVIGSPIALDTNALIAAATSTELPDASTKTYTTANAATSPVDDAGIPTIATVAMADGTSPSVFVLDVPRNITATVTHATSVVAMTITVTGFDEWGVKVVENLSITATGTSKSASGKKAFKWIYSIAITAADDATANTASVGFGDVLGLPYALAEKADILAVYFNDVADTSATIVKAVTTTATATTGDVRGTINTTSASDGSKVVVWFHPDGTSNTAAAGVAQYAG